MILVARHSAALGTWGALALSIVVLGQERAPQTGPETEKRFPPLKVPTGFNATLFACDPLVEYPSAVALGPRSGSIFVAVDFMTGLGTEMVRRDEIRLVEDTDRDGYADRASVYAGEFNSIQGLTYHDGTVYVMHAPFLTALRDTDGDGSADDRRDLVAGLGLSPEQNPVRLHCANGVIMGHDGWLYLALGDHGCDVTRPEGDRLILHGGGILRCRRDGRDLHLFATGLRNIYDVALDEELNVFVRDNENDGGDYKIRVCHSFFGADHGYPYLYYERPEEALLPLADLGLGSSAGGLCYVETAFPNEYRGNLFFCEWGRAVMHCRTGRSGGGFGPTKEFEFAAAAANDPYGFKPTDLVLEQDGSLIVADWADGQRPKRGRGRIYRISAGPSSPQPSLNETAEPGRNTAGLGHWLARLDSQSYYARIKAQAAIARASTQRMRAVAEALGKGQLGVRARFHAVWLLATVGQEAVEPLLQLAETDPDARVRAQAVRAIGDLTDPTLQQHRLDAGPGDASLAARLAALAARDQASQVVLEVIVALGRLRWADSPRWLRDNLRDSDSVLAHAAMQTLRRCGNWSAILNLLDEAAARPIRAIALRAIADRAEPTIVDGLIERLRNEKDPARRGEYADALTRVHRKPGPWTYWGYRPAPRPANTVLWERTAAIAEALDLVLADSDRNLRLSVLRRMQREKIPTRPARLDDWLRDELNSTSVGAILESMRDHASDRVRDALTRVVAGREYKLTNRLTALSLFAGGLEESSQAGLLALASSIEDGPVLAHALHLIAAHPRLQASSLLVAKLNSPEPVVRAAAVEAVAAWEIPEAKDSVRGLLEDEDSRVRLAAASAAGKLQIQAASASLVSLARDANPAVRRASLDSLRLLNEPSVVPLAVAALRDRETQLIALECLRDRGALPQLKPVVELALRDPSAAVLSSAVRVLTKWHQDQPTAEQGELDRAVAQLQGATGVLLRWRTAGPVRKEAGAELVRQLTSPPETLADSGEHSPRWQTLFAAGPESRVVLSSSNSATGPTVWIAYTDIGMSEPATAQFLGSSRAAVRVWLNGQLVFRREEDRAAAPGSDRFEAALRTGANRVVLSLNSSNVSEFALRFRRKSSAADREQLMQAALSRSGNAERGRKLFFDLEKSHCLKCHRLAGQGEQIGPELTGIGSRFSRIHIIESILEPSRTVAPSYQTVELLLADGREFNGILVGEKEGMVTLADSQGTRHLLPKSAIREQRLHSLSAMPEGLEKGWSSDEFIDLIGFLVSQKEGPAQ